MKKIAFILIILIASVCTFASAQSVQKSTKQVSGKTVKKAASKKKVSAAPIPVKNSKQVVKKVKNNQAVTVNLAEDEEDEVVQDIDENAVPLKKKTVMPLKAKKK